ncbi:hypothetical protein OJAV_G00016210 [Oryzias javanicus]|uniref:MADF domain-containing protein n=1 Tax=Oryzias javanicus TaxID=123683 RepID=A0A437DJX2_ORYJA|nr:hypothetical protein OJAV_G00016210 [Oryzias javanicus]
MSSGIQEGSVSEQVLAAGGTIVQNQKQLCGQRRRLDICWNPQLQLHVMVLPPHYVSGKENLDNQQRNSRVEKENPEPPQIKEEQEDPEYQQLKEERKELCISQDEEQLDLKQETETLMETPTYKKGSPKKKAPSTASSKAQPLEEAFDAPMQTAGMAAEEQAPLEPADIYTPPPPPQAVAAAVPAAATQGDDGYGIPATTTTAGRPDTPDPMPDPTQASSGDEQLLEQGVLEITPPTSGKGRGRKGKAAAAAKPKKSWSIEEKVEEEILKWLRANPYLWMRSKKGYKKKKAAWERKAAELGISEGHLECWWKGVKDWHVKLTKKARGQATKIYTERENWVLKNVAFYKGSKPTKGGNPLVAAVHHPSQSSQARATVSRPPDSDQELEASGSNVLEELEAAAGAMPPTQTSSRQSGRCGRCKKHKREERCLEEGDAWMADLRSTMKANQTLLERLLEERPVHTEREAFIRFVSDTLRNVPEEDYAEMKCLILDIISHRPQQPAQSSQLSTSRGRPEFQPSSQQPLQLFGQQSYLQYNQQFNQNFQQQHYFQPQSTQHTQS